MRQQPNKEEVGELKCHIELNRRRAGAEAGGSGARIGEPGRRRASLVTDSQVTLPRAQRDASSARARDGYAGPDESIQEEFQ